MSQPTRVVILGAGFAGLELATILSDELADQVDVTLIDEGDGFVFGFSKLEVMFGRSTLDDVEMRYADFAKPGVRFVNETVTSIDPETRVVTTTNERFEADHLVVALGAAYDFDATPGLLEHGNEFYSVPGAVEAAKRIDAFTEGNVVVGVCDAPFKCPPGPSETALLMHDHLVERGVRDQCSITLVIPFGRPVPPSPDTSAALLDAFEERGIHWVPDRRVASLDGDRSMVVLDDGRELPYDLFLGVPKHRAPNVVIDSGMTEDGYIPVDSRTLQTRWPGVYGVGDVATVGTPKAGVFSERQARVVAENIVAAVRAKDEHARYDGLGSCYVEFGAGSVGRIDVDFFAPEGPTGTFQAPSPDMVADKREFGTTRRARWFGT